MARFWCGEERRRRGREGRRGNGVKGKEREGCCVVCFLTCTTGTPSVHSVAALEGVGENGGVHMSSGGFVCGCAPWPSNTGAPPGVWSRWPSSRRGVPPVCHKCWGWRKNDASFTQSVTVWVLQAAHQTNSLTNRTRVGNRMPIFPHSEGSPPASSRERPGRDGTSLPP